LVASPGGLITYHNFITFQKRGKGVTV
jgi:hypothetical protein